MLYSDKLFYRVRKQTSRNSYRLDFFDHNSEKFRRNITGKVFKLAGVSTKDADQFPKIQCSKSNNPYMVTSFPFRVIGNLWRYMEFKKEKDADYIPYGIRPAELVSNDPVPLPEHIDGNRLLDSKEMAYNLITALDHPRVQWHTRLIDYEGNGQSAIYLYMNNGHLVHNITPIFRFMVHRYLYPNDLTKGFRCADENGYHLQIGYDRKKLENALRIALKEWDARAHTFITMSYEKRGSLNELI